VMTSQPHVCHAAPDGPQSSPQTIVLWPRDAASTESKAEGMALPSRGDEVVRITTVTKPTMTLYRTNLSTGSVPAVLVCPGGGYSLVAMNKEGTEIAQWLNSIGCAAAVLKYRVPKDRPAAFEDVQRAMGLLRHNAPAWGIDPGRIGIIGFSAGGHLAARLSTNNGKRSYEGVDDADKVSCRPDFAILIYPAYLAENEHTLAPELGVDGRTPPTFLAQTQDDKKFVNGSIVYYLALKKAGVPAELHLFPTGGHGYGLRPSNHAVSGWPALCRTWMEKNGTIRP
jgi:acetyl esterase/lipase